MSEVFMEVPSIITEKTTEIPSVPITYVRTDDPSAAEFKQCRAPLIIFGDESNKPYTDEQIIEMVRDQKEAEQWFTFKDWRKKGAPQEQIEFMISSQQVTLYNFNEKTLTDEHLQKAQAVFQEMASRFPQAMNQIRWIMIDNEQLPSTFEDPEKYPTNGMAYKKWKAFQFYPRGTELFPYRIPTVSNFEGVFSHELTHLIQNEFENEWAEKFNWEYCSDHEDDWELRTSPDGSGKKWFNKTTNEMAPMGQFPLQPDKCVTDYAKINIGEDIAESMVAYIYRPKYLKKISPEKYEMLSKHDAKHEKPMVQVRRVPKTEIALPKVETQTVSYYVQEPQEN